jgi:hypothetical protein
MVLVITVVLMLVDCSPSDDDTTVMELDREEFVEEVIEVPAVETEPPTPEDVRDEMISRLPDEWEMTDADFYDVVSDIMRRSEERNIDPVLMGGEVAELFRVVVTMQPAFLSGREGGLRGALFLSWDMHRAANNYRDMPCAEVNEQFSDVTNSDHSNAEKLNPFILASMGYRESRFSKRVITGKKLGGRGERGMFQFMPSKTGRPGFIEATFRPRGCNVFDSYCAARTAAHALAYTRCWCIQSHGDRCNTDTWVAAYGLTGLPNPATSWDAFNDGWQWRGPRNSRRWLCDADPGCEEVWPRDYPADL